MTNEISTKIGIPEKSLNMLITIFEKFDFIEKVVVYGSRAKGNYRQGSDIDLAVYSPTMTFSEQMQLELEIDDLLMPYSVDLLHFEKLTNEKLIEHIVRVGVPVYPVRSVKLP